MYETEALYTRLAADVLSGEVRAQFVAQSGLNQVSLMQWEEHCTECAWPSCYTSCDLYNPRNDGNCRRTLDGFSVVSGLRSVYAPVVRVRFKRWGCLTSVCDLQVLPVINSAAIEDFSLKVSAAAQKAPHFGRAFGRPGLLTRLARKAKRQQVRRSLAVEKAAQAPNCFFAYIYNPAANNTYLSLVVYPGEQAAPGVRYQKLLDIVPGFNSIRIAFEEIAPLLGDASRCFVSITPNLPDDHDEGLVLFFGGMGFGREPVKASVVPSTANNKKIKVLVWDLDNTLWDGILAEQGLGNVQLKPSSRKVVEAMDARGIVNSIASKNNAEIALQQLRDFGIADYFVFPEINWGPKSQSIARIAASFNVGADTLALIDDSTFEREEVRTNCPKTRIYRHDQCEDLLKLPEFDVPVTPEALQRRSYYQSEERRRTDFKSTVGDYIQFLKASEIQVLIDRPTQTQSLRIHELVQRTNQLNFSGNRYSRDQIDEILADKSRDVFLVSATDKYGSYGQVGLAIVARGTPPRVIDLAFSCRVQSKMVEHALLRFLVHHYSDGADSGNVLEVVYQQTDRNQQVGKVFSDLNFEQVDRSDAVCVFRIDAAMLPIDDNIITVTYSGWDVSTRNDPLLRR